MNFFFLHAVLRRVQAIGCLLLQAFGQPAVQGRAAPGRGYSHHRHVRLLIVGVYKGSHQTALALQKLRVVQGSAIFLLPKWLLQHMQGIRVGHGAILVTGSFGKLWRGTCVAACAAHVALAHKNNQVHAPPGFLLINIHAHQKKAAEGA